MPRNGNDCLIAQAYASQHAALYGYIMHHIGCDSEAEDLASEVFTKLLEYKADLVPQTMKNLIFTIARNLIIDYYRRHACQERVYAYFGSRTEISHATEEQIAVDDLQFLEAQGLRAMSPRKAEVYRLYIHNGFSVNEISESLSLSRRTVENHIFAARKEIRHYLGNIV